MAHLYHPLEEKDDIRSSDGESQDNENLLGTRKPRLLLFKSNILWIIFHVLITLCLLVGLRFQSRHETDKACPKLLPLELRKSIYPYLVCWYSDLLKRGQKMQLSMKRR
jgi:hypothetical protein